MRKPDKKSIEYKDLVNQFSDFVKPQNTGEETLISMAEDWISEFTEKSTGAIYPWSERVAKEFRNVPIETLIRDPYFLGMEDKVYAGVLADIVDLFEERKHREIHLAVFLEGIGAGKTLKASLLMWLTWFHLSLNEDPQDFYNLAPRSVIALLMMSRSEQQARRITFGEVWNRFQCPFNKDYFPPSERHNREIRVSVNNTCVYAGTSSALSSLGYNLFGGVIDEACMVLSTLEKIVLYNGKINIDTIKTLENHYHASTIENYSYNILNQTIDLSKSSGIKFMGYKQVYDIELEDGTILGLTGNQRVLIKTSSGKEVYKYVRDLTCEDEFLSL